ncbi:MAG: hypothetical protein D6722_23465, partial [Bacteroidetes bacterium]
IRVGSDDPKRERGSFVVNQLCQLTIRYDQQVAQERVSQSLEMLRDLAQQKKLDVEERSMHLQQERLRLQKADPQILRLQQELQQLEQTLEYSKGEVQSLRTQLEAARKREAQQQAIVPVFQPQAEVTSAVLARRLGRAIAQQDFTRQQIEERTLALATRERDLLQAREREALEAEEAYLLLLQKIRVTESRLQHPPARLRLSVPATSRAPHPWASALLAGMAGLSSLLLWLIMLFQLNYLRWPDHSPSEILPSEGTIGY